MTVFLAASLALTAATAVGVFLGSVISQKMNLVTVHKVSGLLFICIGLWLIFQTR